MSTSPPIAPPTREDLRRCLESDARPKLSLFLGLPERRGFVELESVGKRYRRLVERAEPSLRACGADASEARTVADLLRGVPVDEHAYPADARAVVVLADARHVQACSLGEPLRDALSAGESYRLRPLLRDLHVNCSYRVLVLSEADVRLHEGDRWDLVAVPAPDVPTSLREAVGEEIARTSNGLQFHATRPGGAGAVFHGHGGARRGRDVDRERLYRIVARQIRHRWHRRTDPLVLAADATHQGPFRRIAELPGLLDEGLVGDPGRLDEAGLHERSWAIVARRREARAHERANRLADHLAHELATDRLEDVAMAATSGRVRRLWLDLDARVPGRVDPSTGHLREAPADEDVLDELAAMVAARGGEVVPVHGELLPGRAATVAELRGGRPGPPNTASPGGNP